MSASDIKSPFQSLTITGSVLSLVSAVDLLHSALSAVPVEALPTRLGSVVTGAVGVLGAVLSIVGRFRAVKQIKF